MHHPTDRIAHTTAFVTPVVEHWLEREIAQLVHTMKDRSDDPSHHEWTLLPLSYIPSTKTRFLKQISVKIKISEISILFKQIHIYCTKLFIKKIKIKKIAARFENWQTRGGMREWGGRDCTSLAVISSTTREGNTPTRSLSSPSQ